MKTHSVVVRLLVLATPVFCLDTQDAKAAEPGPFSVTEKTIGQIHDAMKNGELTCRALTEIYMERIAKYDQPTGLNSILIVNPDAEATADQLDREFRRTGKLRPLHGIAVIVKDNYDTHDLPTTAGSLALQGSIPPDDACQIRRLRDAGAIILAKSNMAEFAYMPHFTVSSIGGITRNPYDLERVPAGSSGGTASAVAANLGTIGLGTDTGNSIRGPSSHTALVGLRPTIGLTSRDGIVPLFLRNDVGGPMCRTVKDVARVMDAIAGFDPADQITAEARGHIPATYLDSLKRNGLQGARLGVLRTLSEEETADTDIRRLFQAALSDLRTAGADVLDLRIPSLRALQKDLWRDTFRHDIEQYLKSLGQAAPVTNLQAIIDSGRFHESIAKPLLRSLQASVPNDLEAAYSADPADDQARRELRRMVLAMMNEHQVDALIFPTWNNPPRRIGDLKSPHGNNSPFIAPHTGQPAITVTMGFTGSGLPAGLQLLGRPFGERTLLRLAFAYEQATHHRQPPKLFP